MGVISSFLSGFATSALGHVDFTQIILDSSIQVLGSWADEFIDIITGPLVNISGTAANMLNLPVIQSGIKYVQTVALTLVAIKIIFEGINQYILHESGDDQADPTGLLIRASQAVTAIIFSPWIAKYIFEFGQKMVEDVGNLSSGTQVSIATLINLFLVDYTMVIVIIIIVILLIYMVIFLQTLIRGAEIALLSVVAPIMALGLTSNNKQLWSQWLKQFIVTCSTQAIQIFLIKVSLSIAFSQGIIGALNLLAWFWVTLKAPRILKELSYSSGLGSATGGMARSVGSSMMMRMFMKK